MTKDGENELVLRVQAGDLDAFSNLYEEHFNWVYSFFRSKLGDPNVAGELSQDVFVRAMEGISDFKVGGSFGAWINGITNNVFREYLKKKKNWDKHAPKFLEDVAFDAYPSLSQEDSKKILDKVLAGLTDMQRKILIMRVAEEKSTSEVAKEIYGEDTPENRRKVARNLFRAIQAAGANAKLMR